MKKMIVRLVLAALLGLAWRALSLKADPPAPVMQVQGTVLVYPQGAAVAPVTEAASEPARARPFHAWLNKHGMGCWAHHTEFGCGSFHSEMRFIFGSCRTFFGEPCIPNPPHEKGGVLGSAGCNR